MKKIMMKSFGKNILQIITIALILVLQAGCTSIVGGSSQPIPARASFQEADWSSKNPPETKKDYNSAVNALGYDIMQYMLDEKPDDNVFISPISLHMALSMLQNGAEGETKEQIVNLVGVLGDSSDNDVSQGINEFNNKYVNYFMNRNSDDLAITVANSYWMGNDKTASQPFVDTLKQYYDAEYYVVDFLKPNTVGTMNQWVEDKTNGLLKETVKEFDADTLSVFINTVYFKGTWREQFSEGATRHEDFYVGGAQKQVPMMFKMDTMAYVDGEDYQYVSLSYKDGMSFVIVLPDDEIGDWVSDHSGEDITAILGAEVDTYRDVKLKLPKYDFMTKMDLKVVLKALGMTDAFNRDRADFPYLIEEPLKVWVDKVFQNTKITVDEEGTEAAAVTVIEMKKESAMEIIDPVEFTCNKPFLFGIVDDETKLPLFMGIYSAEEVE